MPQDLPPPAHLHSPVERREASSAVVGHPPLSLLASLHQLVCSGVEHLKLNPVASLTPKAVAHNHIHRHAREAGSDWNFFLHPCAAMLSLDIIWSYIRMLKYILKYFFSFIISKLLSTFLTLI